MERWQPAPRKSLWADIAEAPILTVVALICGATVGFIIVSAWFALGRALLS